MWHSSGSSSVAVLLAALLAAGCGTTAAPDRPTADAAGLTDDTGGDDALAPPVPDAAPDGDGAPDATAGDAGSADVDEAALDGSGEDAAADVEPADGDDPDAPDTAGCQPFSDAPLPAAAARTCYTAVLGDCSGYQVSSGALPPGLALAADGQVSGVPLFPGAWVVGVTVGDQTRELGFQVSGALDLVLSEVMYDPPACIPDEDGEWIELFNPSAQAVSLAGMAARDASGKAVPFPPAAVVPAYGTFVWARDAVAFEGVWGFAPDAGGMALALNNGGDVVELLRDGVTVDCVGWGGMGVGCGAGSGLQSPSGAIVRSRAAPCAEELWVPASGLGQPGCADLLPLAPPPDVPGCTPTACTACVARCPAGPAGIAICGIRHGAVGAALALHACGPGADPSVVYGWTLDGAPAAEGLAASLALETAGLHAVGLTATAGPLSVSVTAPALAFTATPPWLEVHANLPGDSLGLDTALVQVISEAETDVAAALYDLDHPAICEALAAAAEAGRRVQLVTEAQNPIDATCAAVLDAAGVERRTDTNPALMHNKVVVVDAQTTWVGSYNTTTLGTSTNGNNAVVLRDPTLAQIFLAELGQMIARGRFGTKKLPGGTPSPIAVGDGRVAVWFAPIQDVRTELLARIDAAQQRIDLLQFNFSDVGIAKALVEAHLRGVAVRGVLDATNSAQDFSVLSMFMAAGVPVRLDDATGFLHHKVLVIDADGGGDPWAITGSYNLSLNAANSNDESLVAINDPGAARALADLVDVIYTHYAK